MNLKSVLTVVVLFLSFQAEAKMTTFVGDNGAIMCEIDSGGHFEIKEGPCFFSNSLFYGGEFLCESESGEEIHVSKEVFRVDYYTVKAFDYEYVGRKGSGPGIADELVVKNTSQAEYLEPISITFHGSSLGNPSHIEVHMQSGRAPLVEKVVCHSI